jgi:mannose-6-phosphate isomerase-like protein (cupin superfamily)
MLDQNNINIDYVIGGGIKKKPFYNNVEKSTEKNNNYRKVLYTSKHQQFVLMSLNPGEDIKAEVHKDHDQYIRVEKGKGVAIIESKKYKLEDGISVIIPAGSKHQIINNGKHKLKLYTIYSPPEHSDGLIQKIKPLDEYNDIKKKYLKYKIKYMIYKHNIN